MRREPDAYLKLSSQEKRALLASLLRERAQQPKATHPLSHGQKALWLLHRQAPENAAYNTAFAVRVRSKVDTAALRAALQTIVHRHAALRTTFALEDIKPVAVVHAHQDVSLTLVDAGNWSADDLDRGVAEDYRQPFDLERGPLLRVSLYSRREDDHVLLITVHHIVCDAWSLWMLMHELSILYPAAAHGRTAELPPVPAQYSDFVQWQYQILSGPEGERLWEYWRDELAGELPILDLPAIRPRPSVQTLKGASHFFRIDEPLFRGLADVGKAQGATLYVCLMAVFQTLLHRYTGQDDIIVGSPVAGRNNPDMAGALGYFANALPLRADLSGNPTVRELIGQVRETVLGALAHQDLPFPLLIERLQPKRDPSRWPVIEVMLVLQTPPSSAEFRALLGLEAAGPVDWGGLRLEPFSLAQMEGQFDLTWEIVEGHGPLSCALKYNPDLFDREMIERMEGHLKTLIQSVVDDPTRRIGELPLLSAAERKRVLSDWQGPDVAYPLDRCLHHWIEAQVERTPDDIAVSMADAGGGRLSYRELNAKANQLARHLGSLGVGPGSAVGVLAERSLGLVSALLGVLKAGAAYVPLDPEYPPRRLASMVTDAEIAVVLTQGRLAERLPAISFPVIHLDDDRRAIERHDPANPMVEVGPDDLAYVIFTSGSTGQPKGAENTHRAICNRLHWMQDEYRLDGSDRVLQKTPFSFDVSVWEFFWPLMTGATLVMARPGGHRDRDYLIDTIAEHRITTLHFVPSMLQVFLGANALSRCRATLRRVFCSGEALSFKLQQQFFDRIDVELHNLYGPTEAAVDVTHWRCRSDFALATVPIGRPIANTRIYLLDRNLQPVPIGVPGELYIGGVGLARGYRNRPDLTADRFVSIAFGGRTSERLYRTGDLCRWMPDGNIEYLRRIDFQVKLRGFRIELGEIEVALSAHAQVRDAVVRVEKSDTDARLFAWIVPQQAGDAPSESELRRFLRERLPEYMIPAGFISLVSLPLSPNGKVDRATLLIPPPAKPHGEEPSLTGSAVEQRIAEIWREILHRKDIGPYQNFFDLGGHSLLVAEVQMRLGQAFGQAPSMVEMFQFTTIHALSGFYKGAQSPQPAAKAVRRTHPAMQSGAADIAIIGMSGRFPGAADVQTLWANLCDGVESITVFDSAQAAAAGVDPALLNNPSYVPAFGALAEIEGFDADLFGFTPRETELMDVQHRLLLECAWAALEDAGHVPQAEGRRYGMFAGVGMNRYYLNNLLPHRGLIASADPYQLMLANDKDFAPTRVSYKLNLEGPSVSVQTACSTSLVAVHLACRSLLAHECDAALAGGCSVALPQDRGYLYQEGMILSPDGRCRAFDARARGTVGGNGVGLVVLKRLEDALADGDGIYAVIRGSAINNDGSAKAGFTAPSVSGQAAVITAALAEAAVEPDTIGYVEAHGTGTPLGDPIEIAALNRVFGAATARTTRCAIGSVKTNLGHLDTAAGVTGLIKAALAVHDGKVPPSLHYEDPNPALELERTPFYVPTQLQPWPNSASPRRAGVSSFGIGGTNAHVVLEQAPDAPRSGPGRPYQLIVLSAQQATALDSATARLAHHLRHHPDLDLADVAFTLACGRRALGQRRMLVCQTLEEAADALGAAAQGGGPAGKFQSSAGAGDACSVAFMFSGQGSQYPNMAADAYRDEPVFRAAVDRCAGLLKRQIGCDLRDVLYPRGQARSAEETLKQTAMAQPALFVVEYALAQLWMSWGIRPDALIGHSLGEFVAACVAGVWTLEDALALVALRADLMQRQPTGGMLAISLPEADVRSLLTPQLSLAAVNGRSLCVVSGPHEAVTRLSQELVRRDVACQLLQTSHAFHSAMMEPILQPLLTYLRGMEFRPPAIPFISNLTGSWIEPEQAVDPEYWTRHLRHTVRFADGLDTLLQQPERCLLEVGPGTTLASLAIRHTGRSTGRTVVTSLRHPHEQRSDSAHLMEAAGQLWLAGAHIDWPAFYAGQVRRRLHLPAYPFQRQRYWIDPPGSGAVESGIAHRTGDIAEWFYLPSWQRTAPPAGTPAPGTRWLLLMDEHGVGASLADRLARHGIQTTCVHAGARFARVGAGHFVVDPGSRDDVARLVEELRQADGLPDVAVHLWNVTQSALPSSAEARDRSFYSLLFLAQSLGDQQIARRCHIAVVSNGLHDVIGEERLDPIKSLLLGPVAVIPQEYAELTCSSIDLDLSPRYRDEQIGHLLVDAATGGGKSILAYRGAHRWEQIFVSAPLPARAPAIRPGGTYLITGGTGAVGLTIAEWLAQAAPGIKLALVSRSSTTTGERAFQHHERPHVSKTHSDDRQFPRLGEMAPGFAEAHARLKSQRGDAARHMEDIRQALDRVCLLYVARFLQQNGISLQLGLRHNRERIRAQLAVVPKFEKFLFFLLSVLGEDGILAEENGSLLVMKAVPAELAERASREFRRRFPELAEVDDLLQHCVQHYGPALSGEIESISVLFPEGTLDLRGADEQLGKSLSLRGLYIEMLGVIVGQLAERASGRKLRILEVGGGGGELTIGLMRHLRGADVDYHFTDVGRSIVLAAERKAAELDLPSMHFAVLDISRDPVSQGFQPGTFDLVVGLDVIHTTPRIRTTVGHLNPLLRSGGLLCLLESMKSQRYLDMIWGTTDGWWYFEDHELRPSSPLLAIPQWMSVLHEAGFSEVEAWPASVAERDESDFGLVIAQAPVRALAATALGAPLHDTVSNSTGAISSIDRLRALGAEVAILQADAADGAQMRRTVEQIRRRFGDIHGVIHAAGIAGGGTIAAKTRDGAEMEMSAKVDGSLVLADVLADMALDFCVLCSSFTSVTGGFGQVAYSAASAFQDAFAQAWAGQRRDARIISVDWERWQNLGMAAAMEARHLELSGEELGGGMRPAEGVEVLGRILASAPFPRVIVSTRNFPALVRQSHSWQAGGIEAPITRLTRHPRPRMAAEYIAPDGETEEAIAEIWQQELGIDRVGARDDFFALGGDSLIAIKLMSRLRQSLDVPLGVRTLYDAPTISALAEHVASIRWVAEGPQSVPSAQEEEHGVL